MGTYLSPGVYVEDVPPSSSPIAGVSTSTAGFIGIVPDNVEMPEKPDGKGKYSVAAAGKEVQITSWNDFRINFGDIAKNSYLAHAVFGFFHNGGTRCWVLRAADLTKLNDYLQIFEAIDEISIVAIPGETSKDIHQALLDHCMKTEDRVAILDGIRNPAQLTPQDISGTGRSESGSYGAIYFPWIEVFEKNFYVPPSGHIAGIYARNDATRGVHKAPANEVVLGALGLEHRVSKSQQDGLNPEGINVIREFNRAFKVWGGRTLADKSEYLYISTRRYMNFLRESIDKNTQWVVFEPNTPSLWQRITRTVTDFLTNQWRDGALFGLTPKDAFYVRCDENTNPKDVRELGRVITEIGVAIVKPAEFVIFRIEKISGR